MDVTLEMIEDAILKCVFEEMKQPRYVLLDRKTYDSLLTEESNDSTETATPSMESRKSESFEVDVPICRVNTDKFVFEVIT